MWIAKRRSFGEMTKPMEHRDDECGPGSGHRPQVVLQQDLDVLNSGNQPVLNLDAPQSSPAGPFEAVMIGGVGEADFGQVLATLSVPPRGGAVRLLAGSVQQGLMFVTVNRAPRRRRAGAGRA